MERSRARMGDGTARGHCAGGVGGGGVRCRQGKAFKEGTERIGDGVGGLSEMGEFGGVLSKGGLGELHLRF